MSSDSVTVTMTLKIAAHISHIMWHDTLAYSDASPYQVWLQKVQQFKTNADQH